MIEEEKKLYPLRFCALEDEYNWGMEGFRLADLGYRESFIKEGWLAGNDLGEVMDMYMDRIVGEKVYNRYGRQFPVQVKEIKVNGKMPLRVHPDDETASERYDLLGKEKLWYIAKAGSNAELMLGFKSATDAGALYAACLENNPSRLLNIVHPKAGQAYAIHPGTVHAAAGDLTILEISESSPLDFCLCAWGGQVSEDEFDNTLTIADALDFIDYSAFNGKPLSADTLVQTDVFRVNRINLDKPMKVGAEAFDSYTVYACASGEASVQISTEVGMMNYSIKEGEGILIPAECPVFNLVPMAKDTVLLEAVTEPADEKDPYINEEAPEAPVEP